MKRFAAVILMLLLVLGAAWSADLAGQGSDVVLLLDSSESMFPFFDQVIDYVVANIVKDYVRSGDSFHLLTFSDSAQLELSQSIQAEADMRSVVARLYLLYPFGRDTDILTALDYLKQYCQDLPTAKPKVIFMITDGAHTPSEKSPYANLGKDGILAQIDKDTSELSQDNWKFTIITVPFLPDAKSSQTGSGAHGTSSSQALALDAHDLLSRVRDGLGAPEVIFDPDKPSGDGASTPNLTSVSFPSHLGKKDSLFSFPLSLENRSQELLHYQLDGIMIGTENILRKKSFLSLDKGQKGNIWAKVALPKDTAKGELNLEIRPYFSGGLRVSPSSGRLLLTYAPNPFFGFVRSNPFAFQIFLIILVAALLVLLIALLIRNLPKGSRDSVVSAVRQSLTPQTMASEEANPASASLSNKPIYAEAYSQGASPRPSPAQAAKPGADTLSAHAPEGAKSRLPVAAGSVRQAEAGGPGRKVAQIDHVQRDVARIEHKKPQVELIAPQRGGYRMEVIPSKAERKASARRAEDLARSEAERQSRELNSRLKVKKAGNITISLSIDRQNPHIGLRNVHALKAGTRLSVGGWKNADFLVFVIRVPHKLGELFYDGETCSFVPLRRDYFPGVAEIVEDCLDKEIPCQTPNGFKMKLSFSIWENPTAKVNRLLKAIDSPGLKP